MAFWEYTLTGFSDFFEQRHVAFADPMPATPICAICGLLPSTCLVLPCGHILCEFCKVQAAEAGCPFDGKNFKEVDLLHLTFKLCDLERLQVVCVANRQTCTFTGRISELRDHLVECGSGHTKCGKCQLSVRRSVAVDHYRQCHGESVASQSTNVARQGKAPERIQAVVEVQKNMRQRGLSEGHGSDLRNGANQLVERLANLARVFSDERESVSDGELRGLRLRSSRETSIASGPCRAASKPGAFICLCVFAEVYAGYYSLKESQEHTVTTESYLLAGYTFVLSCKFSKDEVGEVSVSFAMALCDGDWDRCLEWPFSKTVTFIIAHLKDQVKDVRFTSLTPGWESVKKPRRDVKNLGVWSEIKKWKDIELGGYINEDCLYVNVEFE
ncbi:uncharacterized protein [Dermacentor albipictus]|uniref:uncharacterized protein n=1 Tax=Dermacentor albipictus TaxID=60249 RepID=UPI0038FC7DCD